MSPGRASTRERNDGEGDDDDDELTSVSITTVYMLIWCLHLLLPLADAKLFMGAVGALDSRPLFPVDYVFLYPLVFAILFTIVQRKPNVPLMVATHAIDIAIRLYRMPVLWDHECWGVLTEIAFCTAYAPCCCHSFQKRPPRSHVMVREAGACFQYAVQLQFGILYAAAPFWKLNSSFMDPKLSCGTLLLLEFAASYSPFSLPNWVAIFIAEAAPTITLLGEGSIAALMLLYAMTGKTWWRSYGIGIAMKFHTIIFLLPVNTAGGFSMGCMSRFICFFSSFEIRSLVQKLREEPVFAAKSGIWVVVTTGSLILLRFCMVEIMPDSGMVLNGLLIVFCSLLIGFPPSIGGDKPRATKDKPADSSMAFVLAVTCAYAFLFPILGIQQMAAPTMYGNLRNYGPSNHYLVPTAILSDDILFGGGLVQVVNSTSNVFNLQLGHIHSSYVFPERVLEAVAVGRGEPQQFPIQIFPYCMSNPHSRGKSMEPYMQSKIRLETEGVFLSYVLPISRVSELLHKAVQAGEEFVVTLADAGTSRNLTINKDPLRRLEIRSNFDCVIVEDGSPVGDCRDDRVATLLLRPTSGGLLGSLARKLLIPYPRMMHADGEVCLT